MARASAVDVFESRRSGLGWVVTARTTPPTSSSVGVSMSGARAPMGSEPPGSSAWIVMSPVDSPAVTRSFQAPGEGMSSGATKKCCFAPSGSSADAVTGPPTGVPSNWVSCTDSGTEPSSLVPLPSTTRMITGSPGCGPDAGRDDLRVELDSGSGRRGGR